MIDKMMAEISRDMFIGAAVAHVTGGDDSGAGILACVGERQGRACAPGGFAAARRWSYLS